MNAREQAAASPSAVGERQPIVTVHKAPIAHGAYNTSFEPRNWDYALPFGDTKLYLSSQAPKPASAGGDPWTPSCVEYDRNIHNNPDAKAWADMFVATFPGLADKHDLMLGWFANAMMAMHDHLATKAIAAAADTEEKDRRAMGDRY